MKPKSAIIVILTAAVLSTAGIAQTKRLREDSGLKAFRCGTVIDPATNRTIDNAVIIVSGGKIIEVGRENAVAIPENAEIVDFSGKFIIPGLIDTHGHLFGRVTAQWTATCDFHAPLFLAAGVTTVRSPGSLDPYGDLALQDRINTGRLLGPRFYNSGPYVEMDPVSVGWMNPVKTPEEARLKIDQWLKMGATSVKIYAKMEGEILKAAIEHGHAHGVKVIGHVGAVSWREAIAMGLDELFHGIHACPDLWDKEEKKPLPVDSPEFKEVLRMAAAAKVVLTPTADLVEPLDPGKCRIEEQKKYFTPEAQANMEPRWYIASEKKEKSEANFERNKQFIKLAHDMGCLLSTGTDHVGLTLLPGFGLWREIEIFCEAGLTPMEALKAATINGAFAIGQSDLLGSIEGGKLADFVVLDADPLKNIRHVDQVYRVVKGGVIYDPESLLKPLAGRIH